MTTKKIIEEISQVANYLWEKGWAERNAGNMSINVTELLATVDLHIFRQLPVIKMNVARPALAGNTFIITPMGSRMREMHRNTMDQLCYIRVNDEGSGFSHLSSAFFESLFPVSGMTVAIQDMTTPVKEFPRPSSELPAHLAIHEMLIQKKPGVKTVIHTHATELIALTQVPGFDSSEKINRLLWGMHPETAMFVPEGAGFVPYTIPGTDAIAEATVEELMNHPLVIWEKHGVFATGRSVTEAFDTIDLMAKSARIYFMVKQTGQEPVGLSDEEIGELRE